MPTGTLIAGMPGQVGDSGLARIDVVGRVGAGGELDRGVLQRRRGRRRPSARRARRPARTARRASAAPGCAPATPWRSRRREAGAGSASSARAIRLTSSPRAATRSGVTSASSSVWPTRIEAIRTCSRPAKVDLGDGAAAGLAKRLQRLAAGRDAPPGRSRPRALPGRRRSAARPARRPPAPRRTGRRPSRRQSAASRHSGPETIVVVCGDVVAVHRRAAEGRLQAGEPAVGGRVADRADPVGAHRAADQPGGDRGAGAARRAAGAALGVPGVAGRPVDGDVAGAAGPVLVHVRHPDDHRPGVAKRPVGTGLAGLRGRSDVLARRRAAPPATAAATRP